MATNGYYNGTITSSTTGSYTFVPESFSGNYMPYSGSTVSSWIPTLDPIADPIPVFADAKTARCNLKQQRDLLKSFEDGLEGLMAERISDAIYFLDMSIEELDKLISD